MRKREKTRGLGGSWRLSATKQRDDFDGLGQKMGATLDRRLSQRVAIWYNSDVGAVADDGRRRISAILSLILIRKENNDGVEKK
ncbi:MAG: hypothetical protein IKK39_04360 [Thermoguttaceae bacterium]|nr:hypothetical protein [Thermoguttaceae bacterium]